jgi:tRNA threonylcarbamoyl adenosine modification protein YeaZ
MPTPSHALAIHTASPELGLAMADQGREYRCQVWNLGRDLSTHLHLHLAEFLPPQAWAALEFMAVAKGPGGFTGTRIGVVTARTLAQQLNIPLFALSTLSAIAWAHRDRAQGQTIAVEMQAQRGEIFAAIYQVLPDEGGLQAILPDMVLSPAQWQETLDDRKPQYVIRAEGGLGSSVKDLLHLAYCLWQQGERPHWSEALPFYGQHPVTG